MNYIVRDIKLAPQGQKKIDWVKAHMPVLRDLERQLSETRPLEGMRISLSIHMEAKTAYLAIVLKNAGAQVVACGSNSLSTQDDVCAALAENGISIFAVHRCSQDDYKNYLKLALEHSPHIVVDDGGELVALLHGECSGLGRDVIGGCEETTTGIQRLEAMEKEGVLKFPMMAVNNARCKQLFDNRYGTGQSVFDSIMRNTNLIIAGKTIVVSGYGWCGKGIAMRAAALGAKVIITEIDSVKAMEAFMDGHSVMTMEEASKFGDIFITVTGCNKVITTSHMKNMKNGAILSNAGHFNVEIDMEALEKEAKAKENVRENIVEYEVAGRQIRVLAEGKLVNIAAADGHPAEIMDLSFAVQLLSALYIKENSKDLDKKLYQVPESIDRAIAERKLKSFNVSIDKLTEEQLSYLNDWAN